VLSVFSGSVVIVLESVLIAFLGTLIGLQLSTALIVLNAVAVPIPTQHFASAHVIVAVAASVWVRVLAGFLRLTHWNTSRVGDM
jgi:hypothetical protein